MKLTAIVGGLALALAATSSNARMPLELPVPLHSSPLPRVPSHGHV